MSLVTRLVAQLVSDTPSPTKNYVTGWAIETLQSHQPAQNFGINHLSISQAQNLNMGYGSSVCFPDLQLD